MKAAMLQLPASASLLGLAFLATGCVTPLVWNQTAAHDWEPLAPSRLFYFPTTAPNPTVIVCFDQSTHMGKQHESRHVAWCPGQPTTSLLAVGSAVRQLTNRFTLSQPMPLFTSESDCAIVSSAPPGYGVWDDSARQLTIYLDGFPSEPFALPTSHTEVQTATRIFVLPLAVAADAAIVCGTAIVICGSGYHGP